MNERFFFLPPGCYPIIALTDIVKKGIPIVRVQVAYSKKKIILWKKEASILPLGDMTYFSDYVPFYMGKNEYLMIPKGVVNAHRQV